MQRPCKKGMKIKYGALALLITTTDEEESAVMSEHSESDPSHEISEDEEEDEDHDERGNSSRFTLAEKALIVNHFNEEKINNII